MGHVVLLVMIFRVNVWLVILANHAKSHHVRAINVKMILHVLLLVTPINVTVRLLTFLEIIVK